MDYDRSRATAMRLIGKFGNGGQATFYRTVGTGFDPIMGTETTSMQVFTALVVVPPMTDRAREQRRIAGWDVSFYVPAGFIPVIGDMVTLPGRPQSFTVVDPVEVVAPDGDVIYCTVYAKRGGA